MQQDKWNTSTPDRLLHPTCPVPDNVVTVAKDIISVSNGSWNLRAIHNLLPPMEYAAIESIVLGDLSFPDRLTWLQSFNGDYSVKSSYAFGHAITLGNQPLSTNPCMDPAFWKLIWGMETFPKIKFFFQRISNNCLPTMESLYQRRVQNNPFCPICKYELETAKHMFVLRLWTSTIWFTSGMNYYIDRQSITSFDR